MPATQSLSPAKLAANRANALRSTGPRTPAGKSRSARNALTHGLSQPSPRSPSPGIAIPGFPAPSPLLPTEDPALYASFRTALLSDLDPRSPLELELADRIVSLHWRLRRCPAIEAELANRHVAQRRRAHEAQQDQPYVRTRDRAPFAPPPAVEFLANQFSSHDDRANPLARLQRYETALDRTLRRCTADYRTLQLTRLAAAEAEAEEIEDPIQNEIDQNEPTTPPRDAGVSPAPPSPDLPNEPNLLSPLSLSPHLLISPPPSSHPTPIRYTPPVPPPDLHHALHLLSTGHPSAAIDPLRRLARTHPHDPSLHLHLARAYAATSQFDRAADACRRAADLSPRSPDPHANLGVCLAKLHRHPEALASFHHALSLPGGHTPPILLNLALSQHALAQYDAALATYDRALALAPDFPAAHEYRGLTLAALHRHPDAIASYHQSLRLHPNNPTAWNNLGASLQKLGTDPAAVLDAFRRAIALLPTYADAHNNLATALLDSGQPPADALPHYDRAIELAPDRPDFRLNRALAYLAAGDFARGWPEHEHRLRCPNYAPLPPALRDPSTRWDGQPAPTKTLLVHAEQGFGDTLQFARFLPQAAARVGRLILQCQPGLERLLRSSFPTATILSRTDPLPPFDLHLPLLSLPALLHTTLDTLPSPIPYLTPPPDLLAHWSSPLSPIPQSAIRNPQSRHIALVWSGSNTDPHRSLSLTHLAPLASLRHATFYSLQLGPATSHLPTAPFP